MNWEPVHILRLALPDKGDMTANDRRALASAVVIAVVVFLTALFGIYTRPIGMLAAIWPANAVLLGILVLRTDIPILPSYVGAICGYVAADLISGGTLITTTLLTAANIVGVAVGHTLYRRCTETDRRLQQPYSVLHLLLISVTASAAAGLVGGIADPVIFGNDALTGWTFWFATELANYLAILPVILSAPTNSWPRILSWRRRRKQLLESGVRQFRQLLPAIAFALSSILAGTVGGPGSVAFPIPALLWCALSYRIWITSILTLLFSLWIFLLISTDRIAPFLDAHSQSTLLSIRLGVAFVAVGPLMVASVMTARNALLVQLERLASHDHLTSVLNRRAFQQQAQERLAEAGKQGRSVAALMFDIDKFKSVNDTHGHTIGDQVISTFADVIRASLRDSDLIGRLGGEEFGALIVDCPRDQIFVVAERIRSAFERATVQLPEGGYVSATVSIGTSFTDSAAITLDRLFIAADGALYQAKRDGRNRTRGG